VLPARLPNLLINGTSGIAVGIATKIPPHNMGEVVAGLKALIHNPDITVRQLMQHIPAPDFPTGKQAGQGSRLAERAGMKQGQPAVHGLVHVPAEQQQPCHQQCTLPAPWRAPPPAPVPVCAVLRRRGDHFDRRRATGIRGGEGRHPDARQNAH
jgi:hypothetical protein